MLNFLRRKKWVLLLGLLATGAIALAIAELNPRLTNYVESDAFRAELEKETAKGLHFPEGSFAPIRRTGLLSAATDGFHAQNGRKAMTTLEAHGVTARFNPLGVFLRRWQLDELHIQSGEVGIQTYEPKPEPSPAKPWYHIFLPDRVYLKRLWTEPADVTWKFREQKAVFFGTRLLITPHGRDFEYDATGGTLRSPLLPDLPLRHTHLVITKERLTLDTLDLAAGPAGDGWIHGKGSAGTREDKSVDFKVSFEQLPIREWLPASWREHSAGMAAGEVRWRGKDPKPGAALVNGSVHVEGGRIEGLPFLEKLAALSRKKSITRLQLKECFAEVSWQNQKAEIKNIAIEDDGKFRIEGSISLQKESLGGTIRLGVAPGFLEWLPHVKEVFPRAEGDYHWTTVHLSGTLDAPKQDLSPRVIEALKESPDAFLGAIFRQFGEWLKNTFGGE